MSPADIAGARGAFDAQRWVFDLRHGLVPPGSLADRMRVAMVAEAESAPYLAAFCRQIEKVVALSLVA